MPKTILLIDSDAALASELSRTLEERNLRVRSAAEGAEGLEQARSQRPDAIVLCVELPKMSGYAICQRIRKDDGLKSIPLVITSSEATPETFENHKKLKVRADAYLHKPFTAAALLDVLRGPLQLPDAEELVTLDDVENLSGEFPIKGTGKGAEPVRSPEESKEKAEDLKLLDDAFDRIAAEPTEPAASAPREEPLHPSEVVRAPEPERAAPEPDTASAEIDRLGEEADRALAELGADVEPPSARPAPAASAAVPPAHGEADDLLRAAGIHVRSSTPAPGGADAQEVSRLESRISELLATEARAREALARRDEEVVQLRAKLEGLEGRLRGLDGDQARRQEEALRAAEELQGELEVARATQRRDAEARREAEEQRARAEEARAQAEEASRKEAERAAGLEADLAKLRHQAEEAEQAASLKAAKLAEAVVQQRSLGEKIASLEAELSEVNRIRPQMDALRGELDLARAEAEGARGDAARRSAELQKRVQELEALNAKHEERVVKAYQKIKSDEKIREKTRKALAIALQLLDERLAASPVAPEGGSPPRRD